MPGPSPQSGRSAGTSLVSNAGTGCATRSGLSSGAQAVSSEATQRNEGAVASRALNGAPSESMGVATDAAFPLGLIVVGTVAVIVVLNLIAAIPARSAGRLPVADALRSE